MDAFLIHCLLLAWLSLGAARQLTGQFLDQLLAAAMLAWSNIVITSLVLSALHRLGEPGWFFGTSLFFAGLCSLLMLRMRPEVAPASGETAGDVPTRWLLIAFLSTVALLGLGNLAVAWAYQPNNPDALTWQLPRLMFYIGQNSLGHFDAADLRQTHSPFNYHLLSLLGLVHGAPLQCLNLFNLLSWALGGISAYRLCRLSGCTANASLITSWLVLTALPVVAQATASTIELPVGAGLLCALLFGLRHAQTGRTRFAMLSGLAAGLVAGSDLRAMFLCVFGGLALWVWSRHRSRSHQTTPNTGRLQARVAALLLACALSAPFAVINLATGTRELDTYPSPAHSTTPSLFDAWTGFLPLLHKTSPLQALNEEVAGFGFTGLLFLACTARFVLRRRTAGWLVWLAFVWSLAHLLLGPSSVSSPQGYVPALLLLCPCVAAILGSNQISRPLPRFVRFILLALVVLAAGWSAAVYLLKNTSRPLVPLLSRAFISQGLPSLPLLMEHHLSRQSHINIETDGINELLLPLMRQGRHQRFTSHRRTEVGAYNLFSRSSLSRHAAYRDPAYRPSYTLISIPTKRTAGVEFLGTIGNGLGARDYFGLVPAAGQTAPIATNRNVLVTFHHEIVPPRHPPSIRLQVAGLNPGDLARLTVDRVNLDGSFTTLVVFNTDGTASVSKILPFQQLAFRVRDLASGLELGSATISYLPSAEKKPHATDPGQPTRSGSLFVTDLVTAPKAREISAEGLLPVEGPFPQWDLPHLRWQRQPSVVITIPQTDGLATLQLSFSVRLYARRQGALDVIFNGQLVQRFRVDDPGFWLDQTLEFSAQPGPNLLEFRDVSLHNEPDWSDYLDRYPDVKKHVTAQGVPLTQGAQEHYETHGRAEGRVLQTILKPEPVPDGHYFMYRNIRLEGFKK